MACTHGDLLNSFVSGDSMPEERFGSETTLHGIHVLLVVHDPESCRLLTTVLEYAGALVSAVASARGALTELQSLCPDVLLADLGPDDNGALAFIERVRALPRSADVPAIVVRARGARDAHERLLQAGVQQDIVKPIDPWELCRLVAALVERR